MIIDTFECTSWTCFIDTIILMSLTLLPPSLPPPLFFSLTFSLVNGDPRWIEEEEEDQ
jgi:hypothetical protein